MTLPTDAKARKRIPIYSGCVAYFPDALAAVAELSQIGNDQHHPGEPLHWDKSKSMDELDALMRHAAGCADDPTARDTDGVLEATKIAWRALANLQRLADDGVNVLAEALDEPLEGGFMFSSLEEKEKFETEVKAFIKERARQRMEEFNPVYDKANSVSPETQVLLASGQGYWVGDED